MSVRSYKPTGGLGAAARTGATRSTPSARRTGFLGSGIGPDVGLGLTRTFKEIGQGLTALATYATPAKDGPGLTELFKGMATSGLGTIATGVAGHSPAAESLADTFSGVTEGLWGEGYGVQTTLEKGQERGILPALVEDVGNISLGAAGVTAPVKAASVGAKFAGATETAARLSAAHKGLLAKPHIQALQHPYVTAAKGLREAAMKPALLAKVGPSAPTTRAAGVAQSYYQGNAETLGLGPRRQVKADGQAIPETGQAISQAYADMDGTMTPEVQASYDAFIAETEAQAKAIQESGVTFEFVDEDPYASPADMMKDVEENGRLKVFRTTGAPDNSHPYLTPEQNNLFRAVHDFFGHSELANDFSRHGEEVAWASHAQMYSPTARGAMTTETRGQNSWFNFSPESEARRAQGLEPEFPEQKTGLLPEEFQSRDDLLHPLPESQGGAPLGRIDNALAKAETMLQAREAQRLYRNETKVAESARRQAYRSEAIQTSVAAAQDQLIDATTKAGSPMTRQMAERVIASELELRLTGLKSIQDDARAAGLPEDVIADILPGKYEPIPAGLDTPELEAALAHAVDGWKVEAEATRATLVEGRLGDRGLTGLADDGAVEPALSKADQKRLSIASKKLERARNLDDQVGRERAFVGREIASTKDRLGKLATEIRDIDGDIDAARKAFDHARTYVPKAWRTAAGLQRTVQDIFDQTMAAYESSGRTMGGATYDPHTGRYIEAGVDEGHMVGILPGTAVKPRVEDFTPGHILEMVEHYQDLFQNKAVKVGTWIDEEGWVHIDPSEQVPDIDDAFIRSAARTQEAYFDLQSFDDPHVNLRRRPDIAEHFLERNTYLKNRSNQVRKILERDGTQRSRQVQAWQEYQMRAAVSAWERGKVTHPDEWFKQLPTYKAGKTPTKRSGVQVFKQIMLGRDVSTPTARGALWAEVEKMSDDLGKSLQWYNRSHEAIERLLRSKPEITLLDGETKINPADLTYQLLAATSFKAQPRDNLRLTMKVVGWVNSPAADAARATMGKVLAEVSAGKRTLDDALLEITGEKGSGLQVPYEKNPRLQGVKDNLGLLPVADAMVNTILSGQTMDKWTPEFVTKDLMEAWGGKIKDADLDEAFDYVQSAFPEFVERATQLVGEAGPDAVRNQAVREYWGSDTYTKLMSFWDNLSAPETSQAVTMDMWMARLLGVHDFSPGSKAKRGNWVRGAEGIRAMAEEISQTSGEKVLPHQVQAALWGFANSEIARVRTGHFLAYAHEASELVGELAADGALLTDDIDPILAWVEDYKAPYQKDAPTGINEYKRQVRRGEETSTEAVLIDKDAAPKERGKGDNFATDWLKARENVNALLADGDADGARALLTEWAAKTRNALDDEVASGDFMDVLTDKAYHSKTFKEVADGMSDYLGYHLGEELPLLQAFKDKVAGEFLPGAENVAPVIRVLEDGNLATLVHEDGHFIQSILDGAQMSAIEHAFGIKGGKWTTAHHEKFADSFMKYMSGVGDGHRPKGLDGAFAVIRSALKDIFDMVKKTVYRGRIHPALEDVFSELLDPPERASMVPEGELAGLDLPDPETGTPAQRLTRPPATIKDAGTKSDLYHAGRKSAASWAQVQKLAARRRQVQAVEQRTGAALDELRDVLEGRGTKAERTQQKLEGEAGRLVATVQKHIDASVPAKGDVPVRWRPLYEAATNIRKLTKDHPELATVLEELPQTLGQVQTLALERGFDPVHVRQFSPTQVKRLAFGVMRLGLGDLTENRAGTRNARTGALERAGGVERSLAALMSAGIEATVEARTNAVIDWVEKTVARPLEKGAQVPDGWEVWSGTRNFLLTGQEISEETGRALQTAPENVNVQIVPKSVTKTLRREVSDPHHWSYDAISKVTNPWRALVLTLSPGWYVRNIAGNVILAEAEGVKLRDWKAAWDSYRKTDRMGKFADIPFVTTDTLATEAGRLADDSVIPMAGGRQGLKQLQTEGGKVRGSADYVQRRLLRVNQVVDEMARAAVFHQGRRLNMSPEAAWSKASEALVDYGNLSPFERRAVRAVIPFYSWQKGILRVTMRQAIDHPARAGILAQLGQMHDEHIADLLGLGDVGEVPDYYAHLVGKKNLRGYNPFADPSEILSPEGITRSMNPFVELFIRKGLGAPEFFPDSHRMGPFGSAEPDVDMSGELTRMLTNVPAGRAVRGESGGPANIVGLGDQDLDKLRERIARARKTIDAG